MSEAEVPAKAKRKSPKQETQEQEMKQPGPVQWKPTYQQNAEFDSHLFTLKTTKMKKNVSWNASDPDIREVDHQHFFHTMDSSGKEMTMSAAAGGHFHIMTVTKDPETGAPIATCSGPMMFDNRRGRKVIVPLPAFKAEDKDGNVIVDDHKHEVVYSRSSLVKPRTVNAESVKVIDQLEAQKEQRIPGIQG